MTIWRHRHKIIRFIPKTEQPAHCCTGRPVDCLGLTKRWSLYVASTATPGPAIKALARPTPGPNQLTG